MKMQDPDSLIRSMFNGAAQAVGMQDGDAIGLDLFRKYIRPSWRVGLLWAVGFPSVGVAFSVFAPSYYTARTTLLINEPTMRPANENGPIIPDPAFVESQIHVLQSNEVFDRVLGKARLGKFGNLAESSIRFFLLRQTSSWGLVETNAEAVRPQALIAACKHGLLVRRVGTSNAVEIAFTARDPGVVANVANAFAGEYLASEMDLKQAAREQVLEFFRNRLDELQNRAFAADPQDGVTAQGGQNGRVAHAKWRETQSRTQTYRDLIFGASHTIWRFATDDVLSSADDLLKVCRLRPTECVPLLEAKLGDGDRTADVLSLRAKGMLPEANASQSLRHHLHESAPKYEWVVLGLNPMNCSADLDATTAEIAFVVLVISAGETTFAALDQAADVIPYGKRSPSS
jgi:hypothetical protein